VAWWLPPVGTAISTVLIKTTGNRVEPQPFVLPVFLPRFLQGDVTQRAELYLASEFVGVAKRAADLIGRAPQEAV